MGANPNHRDLFLEIDFMQFHRPNNTAITNVVNAFAAAPIKNPDNTTGINLHILVDEQIPHQDTLNIPLVGTPPDFPGDSKDWTGYVAIKNTNFGTAADRADPNSANIKAARLLATHYGIFAHNFFGGVSGLAELPGNDFIVTLGSWDIDPATLHRAGSVDQQQGTLLHEFGHNLNLHHGGESDDNCKPNYLSVMSYAFQMNNTLLVNRPLDYSRSQLPSLNERNLAEPTGIGASTPAGLRTVYGPPTPLIDLTGIPLDWNRDGDLVDANVTANINNVAPRVGGCSSTTTAGAAILNTLNGHNDWEKLVYNFTKTTPGRTGISSDGSAPREISIEDLKEFRLVSLSIIDSLIDSLPNNAFRNPELAQSVKSGVSADVPTEPTDSIAVAIQNDDLNTAISELSELREVTDSTIEGGPIADDIIVSRTAQQELLPLIDSFIAGLEGR
jgi:hypothetical protein